MAIRKQAIQDFPDIKKMLAESKSNFLQAPC